MKKRAILLLAAILIVAAALAGCSGNSGGNTGGNSGGNTGETGGAAGGDSSGTNNAGATSEGEGGANDKTFTIRAGAWFIDERGHQVAFKKAVEDGYKKLYPNATIQWDITLGATYFDKLKAQFASDTAPDVTFYQSLDYAKAGNLMDLSGEPWVSRMNEAAKKDPSLSYEGKLYGAPGAGNIGGGIWYNKDLFDKLGIQPPKTVQEFLDACEKIKADGKTPIALGFKDLWTANMFLMNWLQSYTFPTDAEYGMKLYDGTVSFDDAVIQKVYQNVETMKSKGYFNKNALSIDWPQSAQLFASGDAAMIVQGPWMPSANAENIDKGGYDKFQIGFFPFMDEGGKSSMTFASGTGLGINAKTKLVQESKDLVALMLSPEVMAPWLEGEGGLPMFTDVNVKFADPVMDTVKQYLDGGLTLPYGLTAFMATSSANAMVDVLTKVVSGVKFNPADLKAAQDAMTKDKATIVLPQT
ncbi:ABC transporter substrate-binding protein [Paenibacillus mendelii]|uniref:ABC transporter substrate-binding protein n=1 Tax=Paenibacillus mendelii TaxID=206163 RepID=A0ABV6JLI4_9BACL|nr:extracellular solute-binding protein [Paenibacillus mendelii]MCQ6562302.1 extracellular solute-binding protein [Paenibacillus mendelii]